MIMALIRIQDKKKNPIKLNNGNCIYTHKENHNSYSIISICMNPTFSKC